jgi:hypothetical protein
MTNDFDIGRGAASGRIGVPGSRTFVLGSKDLNLAHVEGDDFLREYARAAAVFGVAVPIVPATREYSEVKQVVDLTDYDILSADLVATGRAAPTFTGRTGWASLARVLKTTTMSVFWGFDFDAAGDVAYNYNVGQFNLTREGEITYGTETYSPDASRCLVIPDGAASARMSGVDNPPVPMMIKNTLSWWMKFDADKHAGSTGISPNVFSVWDANNGWAVSLVGVAGPGAHAWNPALTFRSGGVDSTVVIAGYTITASMPWTCFTIVYDNAKASPNKVHFFVNGVYVCNAAFAPAIPLLPGPTAPIQYGDPLLVGELDSILFLPLAVADANVIKLYEYCTIPLTVSFEWRMQILVDGCVLADRVIPATESERVLSDFSAPVRQYSGPHEVAFRLVWATV